VSGERPWSEGATPVAVLAEALAGFNADRDWEAFHTPKDLAMALSVEAAEVVELYLWRREGDGPDPARLRQELGDVLITLVNLARRVGVDLMAAAQDKLALNAERYPVERARGSALKYDALRVLAEEGDHDPP